MISGVKAGIFLCYNREKESYAKFTITNPGEGSLGGSARSIHFEIYLPPPTVCVILDWEEADSCSGPSVGCSIPLVCAKQFGSERDPLAFD